jgi:N-acylglucosamine-6-phosphate 2-epimerase
MDTLKKIKNGLIVSSQAKPGEPFFGPKFMAAYAKCAEIAGAVGIRCNTPVDIRAIRKAVTLPILGIWKIDTPGCDVYITPTYKSAVAVIKAGADVVCLDGTPRKRPNGETFEEITEKIHKNFKGILVMADISTYEEGVRCEAEGADLVSTTLSGYTPYSTQSEGPDFALIRKLSKKLNIPVIGEGKVWTPEEAAKAMKCGAYALVVGSAITRPIMITERFVNAIKNK